MKDTDKNHSNDRSKNDSEQKKAASSPMKPPNPPHTTTGKLTSPKFGSAGSGGAELEPGPEES
jgi:hypothetical protein